MSSLTSLSAMTRDAASWPRHRKKKIQRDRQRAKVARAAQRKIDDAQGRKL